MYKYEMLNDLAEEFDKASKIASKDKNFELEVSYKNAAEYIRNNLIPSNNKCEAYHEREYIRDDIIKGLHTITKYECWGMKEPEECHCNGDKRFCERK